MCSESSFLQVLSAFCCKTECIYDIVDFIKSKKKFFFLNIYDNFDEIFSFVAKIGSITDFQSDTDHDGPALVLTPLIRNVGVPTISKYDTD
jgi:hypothetical protein